MSEVIELNIYGRYRKYSHIRDAVWQTLVDYNVNSLPVSLHEICRKAEIRVLKNSNIHELSEGESGVSINQNGVWYIIFDDYDTVQRARFTIAHELGHIFLGHEMLYGYYTRKTNIAKPAAETEADMFASRLLAPACILWGIGAETPEEIANICNISYTAADIRSRRMKLLRSRGKFLSSQLEQQVFNNFSDFMKANKKFK